jgi:hypothetical protein
VHFMSIYTFHAEHKNAAVARFKETGGAPPAGIKLLARWHDVGGRRGFTICEADDPVALSIWSNKWSDLMKIEVFPVVNDEQLVKVLSS